MQTEDSPWIMLAEEEQWKVISGTQKITVIPCSDEIEWKYGDKPVTGPLGKLTIGPGANKTVNTYDTYSERSQLYKQFKIPINN